MSPDLLPEHSPDVQIRLRFYELDFAALGRNASQPLAPTDGVFREAVVGFPAKANGIEGEASLFMWTDSDIYLMWAREAFGWPLLRGEIELFGSIWESSELVGATGGASLREAWGSASVADAVVREQQGSGSPAGCWLTPRRVLRRAGLGGELRELLVVRPEVRSAGARYTATGTVQFDFRPPHPLHAIETKEAALELVDGFELVVGKSVDVL